MKPVNRALVEALLADETLSYKEIARQAGCSDFSVRTLARKLSGDERPMKTPRVRRYADRVVYESDEDSEPRALTWWGMMISWSIAALVLFLQISLWKNHRFQALFPDGPMS